MGFAMDPNNHVVKLCMAGMRAEGEGRPGDAKALYEQAWAEHETDYEACIAAHYLARRQARIEDELEWNEVALAKAAGADSTLVSGFYASLHLNLGHSCEKLGRIDAALTQFRLAEDCLESVPDGPYKDLVSEGVTNALARVRQQRP